MRYIQLLVLVLWSLFSTQLNAQTSTKKPVTTAKKTTTVAKKPVTTAKKTTTVAKKPVTTAKKPTTVAKKSTVLKKKPTTVAKKSTVVKKKPTTVAKKSTVVKKKPTTAAKKPTPKAPLASTAPKTTQVGTTKCAELTKIAQIQCCLREKGYDPGETDNTLNTKTRQALAQFQKDNYLPQGDLSIETMRALGVSK